MYKVVATIIIFVVSISAQAQKKSSINWISFEDAEKAYQAEPRPILIDIYTDWCGWCKKMDKATYGDKNLVEYVNRKFYAVKFNAENRKTIHFNNQEFKYEKMYKVNMLAMYLSYNQLSFPQTVFLSSPSARPAPISGYLRISEIEAPLKFFGENAVATQSFADFQKGFKRSW